MGSRGVSAGREIGLVDFLAGAVVTGRGFGGMKPGTAAVEFAVAATFNGAFIVVAFNALSRLRIKAVVVDALVVVDDAATPGSKARRENDDDSLPSVFATTATDFLVVIAIFPPSMFPVSSSESVNGGSVTRSSSWRLIRTEPSTVEV